MNISREVEMSIYERYYTVMRLCGIRMTSWGDVWSFMEQQLGQMRWRNMGIERRCEFVEGFFRYLRMREPLG